MNSKFTQKAQNSLNFALEVARELGHTYIGSEHILLGISSERESAAARILISRGGTYERLFAAVKEVSGSGNKSRLSASDITPCVKKIIESSGALSDEYGQNYIGTEHILLALLQEESSVGIRVLEQALISALELKNDLIAFFNGITHKAKKTVDKKDPDRTVLSGFGHDLTKSAKSGRLDPVIGRAFETDRVIRTLSRRIKNNPCLIGEPGVGKTAVIEGLAQKIACGDVPKTLIDKKIIVLDIPSMIAGAKYRGEFEDRMKNVMKEVTQNPDIILFIDEIHTIVGAGAAEGAVDAANIIKPALARGDIRIIGATTISEYRKYIEKDAALERRFQPITVEEPSESEAKEILYGLRDRYEAHHGVKISSEAIDAAVTLSMRYIPDRFLPDKALDLIDETAARLRVSSKSEPDDIRELEKRISALGSAKEEAIAAQNFERAALLRDEEHELRKQIDEKNAYQKGHTSDGEITISALDISETISEQTGIPICADDEKKIELLELEKKLSKRIIGQDEAIKSISKAVRRGRAGISDPKKPTGTFIFLGPTGVGKTELAAALAEAVFGSKSSLVRFDMSEYMEKHSVAKLIGSPPGYIGYDEGGLLSERVRRHPYSLVLFDEIEKAHPDIFNLLLQILDEGILTDSRGRMVNFKNTIIIMTSNLGTDQTTTPSLGFFENSSNADEKNVYKALRKTFRPEFINRIDDIIIFKKLKKEDLIKISKIRLAELSKRCATLGISLNFDNDVVEFLADNANDERYGARPIRRAITMLLEDPISSLILEKNLSEGDSIQAFIENGKISFK